MDRLRTDLRYAVRMLVRSPIWTAIAVVSLALGIGANAVVFSLVDAVLLEPFPYRDSGELVLLWGSKSEKQTPGINGADLNDWRAQNRTFDEIDAFLGGDMKFSLGASEADRVAGACMGHRVLTILGVQPVQGRSFSEREARLGAAPVVLISDALWRSRYASRPDIVGGTILVNGQPHEVVGIMPPGFFFPDTDARLWVPAPCGLSAFDQRGGRTLHAIGRLRARVAPAAAQADIDRIDRLLAKAYPDTNQNRSTGVFPLRNIVIGKYEQALWTLVWAIALVLLIACANVVHLQLARGVDRETELAVRGASGASRARLLRQLLTESFVLVAVSAIVGLFVAWIGVRLVHAFSLTDIPRMEHARVDARVLGFTLLVSLATALLSSLWPAWKASGVQISETLKLGSLATTGASRSHVRDLLAVTEIAATVTLLVASGLIVKSFVQLSRSEWGFNPDRLLLIDVELPRDVVLTKALQPRLEIADAIRARLEPLPGVERVAVGENAPIRWNSWSPRPVAVDGRVVPESVAVWLAGHGHFATAGIPIHEGREFSSEDDERAPRRVVISRTLAMTLWPGRSAIGQSLQILGMKMVDGKPPRSVVERFRGLRGWPPDISLYEAVEGANWEVIGVASDVRMFSLQEHQSSAVYIEMRQMPRTGWFAPRKLKVLLRTTGDPMHVATAAKAQIAAVDKELKFVEIVSLADLVAQSIGGRGSNKLLLIVATVFGALSLTFATIGIYGVVAHNVTERLREIGIRVALGAARRDVVRIVMGYCVRLMIGGFALGVTAAWAATRGMGALLFATTPLDAFTYTAVIATLAIAALAACAAPLRRALGFDPVVLFKA